jgi:large subunit ribosomal protein L24
MKEWSNAWKGSKKPKKQRKFRYNAPLHVKRKFCTGHISKEIREKYGKRNIGIIKGDKIQVVRGQYKGHIGKVEKVNVKKCEIIIVGIEVQRKDGSKSTYPIHPSNVIITELNLEDKKRSMKFKKQSKE